MKFKAWLFPLILLIPSSLLYADGAADNAAANVRPIPPPGIAVPAEDRDRLAVEVQRLGEGIEAARVQLTSQKPALLRYLPDVQIFHKAVDWALRYEEIYEPKQIQQAEQQLREGNSRLQSLLQGNPEWLRAKGLVVRGYLSSIDDSIQPFGMVIPETWQENSPWRYRLDCWFHGRGEKLTELAFLHQRSTDPGEFAPPDTLVLHPYGRYCNGQRFAGETDFFEALAVVKRDYRIDPDRIAVRGFSLGGAACWHLAVHHASQWCVANPGAGFSETEQFLRFFQGEALQPAPWERKLWQLYDATSSAGNLLNLPTIAYSGELDKQKQAADLMAAALASRGVSLTHRIGPGTAHKYESATKAGVAAAVDEIASKGRLFRTSGRWETATLKYADFGIGTIQGLQEHWSPATLTWSWNGAKKLTFESKNITALELRLPGPWQALIGQGAEMEWIALNAEDQRTSSTVPLQWNSDGTFRKTFQLTGKDGAEPQWRIAPEVGSLPGLRKKPQLQGPIDDAFMGRFLFVRPTGPPTHEKCSAWVQAEMDRAITQWRKQFRGDVRIKDDSAVTEQDVGESHLILWGEPSSNSWIARIAGSLPIQWSAQEVKAGAAAFSAPEHALLCIYPNPLNAERYVVLNSGFTFREYDALNNARQTPKLPDWAVVNLGQPPDARFPGKITAAGFFGESWEWKNP